MTQPFPPPPGRPQGRRGGDHVTLSRALILLVVAVVVGAICLALGARPVTNTGAGAAATSTTTTTAPSHSTTTTTTLRATTAVKVLVANGSSTIGAAGYYTTKLKTDGWGTLTPTTATSSAGASTVYYAAGNEPQAQAIATSLGLGASAVQPLSSATPVSSTAGADVVLVVGPDLGGKVTTTTSTTAGTSATSTTSSATTTTTTPSTATATG